MAKQKLLVIRFSSIGDIILTTPVFRCLVEQAGAEVHLLTKSSMSGLLASNPYVAQIQVLQEDFRSTLSMLKAEGYDYVVDLQNNLRSHRFTAGLKMPYSRVNKLNIRKWLLVNTKIDRMPDVHIVDRYLAAAAPLGVKNDNQGLDYYLPDDEASLIEEMTLEYHLPPSYVAIVIGAAHNTKQIPVDKIAQIVDGLQVPTVLVGGPSDTEKAEKIMAESTIGCINLVGRLSIDQSAIILDRSMVVVTSDTGMMHIAAARKKPIVSIWGNTVPQFGMYPYMPTHPNSYIIYEQEALSCRPCSKIGFETCPKGHFKCMLDMDIRAVVEKIQAFID